MILLFSAHVGYQTALDSGVRLLTESTQLFMERMLHNLRIELDRSLENNMENMGWTDILEKVRVTLSFYI